MAAAAVPAPAAMPAESAAPPAESADIIAKIEAALRGEKVNA